MTTLHRRWTRLGFASALLGTSALSACNPSDAGQSPADTAQMSPSSDAAPSQLESGEAGEAGGGEHGEGGVDVTLAAQDPVVFAKAMAVIEAHVRAAMDAAAIGETDAAGEMFAHPVSEILIDLEPVLPQYGVAPMEDALLAASGAALEGAPADEIQARGDDLILQLRAAAAAAGTAPHRQAARVIADQVDRATAQYRAASRTDAYGPYLDGYGFYRTAQAILAEHEPTLRAQDSEVVTAITDALRQLGIAYPDAARPEQLAADPAALTAANSELQLVLGN